MGNWGIRELRNWGIRELGNWELGIGKLGNWGIGAGRRLHYKVDTDIASHPSPNTVSRAPAHPCPPLLASIPRYIKSPPGGELGNWELGIASCYFLILLTDY